MGSIPSPYGNRLRIDLFALMRKLFVIMTSNTQSEEPFVYKSSWSSRIVFAAMLMSGVGTSLVILFIITAFFFVPQRVDREMSRRIWCQRNLSQIGLALRSYHNDYDHFPPAYTVDVNGRKLHSWRTLILPFLGERDLYDRIDLSKPWDDPVNAAARNVELKVFRCPVSVIPSNHTSYLAIMGEEFAFVPSGCRRLDDFKDEPDQTAMVTEVPNEMSVEWMSPEDISGERFLEFDLKTVLPHRHNLVQVIRANGTPLIVSFKSSLEARRALLTIAGNDDATEVTR